MNNSNHNTLLRKYGDRLVWDTPLKTINWDVVKTQAGGTMLRTSFSLSEDQNCTFTLYRRVYAKFDKSPTAIIEDNLEELQQPSRWRVATPRLHENRIGLVRFTYMPLATLVRLWRKPINPRGSDFAIIRGNQEAIWTSKDHLQQANPISFSLGTDYKVEPFVVWPGIFELVPEGTHTQISSKYFCRVKEEFKDWLKYGTKGNLYLFSDHESTFESKDDEWIYLTDYGLDAANPVG